MTVLKFEKLEHPSPGQLDETVTALGKWRSHRDAAGYNCDELDEAIKHLCAYRKLLRTAYVEDLEEAGPIG